MQDSIEKKCVYCGLNMPNLPTFLFDGIFAHQICVNCENYEVMRASTCSLCEISGIVVRCAEGRCQNNFHVPCLWKWYVEQYNTFPKTKKYHFYTNFTIT